MCGTAPTIRFRMSSTSTSAVCAPSWRRPLSRSHPDAPRRRLHAQRRLDGAGLVSPVPPGHRLSIRARLAVSYGLVMVAVLSVIAFAVGAVHERLGLARLDTDLAHAMRSAAGVVNSEITERRSLAAGALEGLIELELPGVGVSVLDDGGRLLATRFEGAPALNPERQRHIVVTDAPLTLEPERLRVTASRWRHGSDAYTVVAWTALAPLDRDHATVMNTVRIAIPIAALAALAGGWLIVWRALRPLSQTAACADAIDPGHLDARLPVPDRATSCGG